MSTEQQFTNPRIAHGVLLLVLLVCTSFVPHLYQNWPWGWLAPLIVYFALAVFIPSMRCSLVWLRLGRVALASLAVTLLVMIVTALVLLGIMRVPHTGHRPFLLPFEQSCGLVAAGVLFSVINAVREEFICRGVLYDSLDALWGNWAAIGVSALIFGMAHLQGVPSGISGALLAGLYGLALGGLRVWTGGLLLPVVAHIAADATIFYLMASSGNP